MRLRFPPMIPWVSTRPTRPGGSPLHSEMQGKIMAQGTRKTGEFCWINILAPRPDEERAFFGSLLGWTYSELPGIGHLIKVDGEEIGGFFDLEGPNTPPGTPPMIGVMVKVESADAAGEKPTRCSTWGRVAGCAVFMIPPAGTSTSGNRGRSPEHRSTAVRTAPQAGSRPSRARVRRLCRSIATSSTGPGQPSAWAGPNTPPSPSMAYP